MSFAVRFTASIGAGARTRFQNTKDYWNINFHPDHGKGHSICLQQLLGI